MSLEVYRRVLSQLAGHRPLQRLLLYKDGESLLHPDFPEFPRLAKQAGVSRRIEIHSNIIPLQGRLVDDFLYSGLDVLFCSIDATSAEDYQKLKGVDKFETVSRNIRKLMQRRGKLGLTRPQVVVRYVDKGSAADAKRFRRLFGSLADVVEIAPLHHWDGSITSLGGNTKGSKRWPCVIPWYNPVILWDGRVSACCINYQDNELIMGDTAKQSLEEIWQGKKFTALRQAHLTGEFADWQTCAHCPHWRFHPGWILSIKNKFGLLR